MTTKPVSYFVAYPIGANNIVTEIEREWGDYYQKLSSCEKFYLLAQLSRNLFILFADDSSVRDAVHNAAARIKEEIPPEQVLGLIEALCDQLHNKGG